VHTGKKAGRFDDVVGRGFGLVSTVGDPMTALGPEQAAYFASIGGFAAHVAPTGPIRDLKGSYQRWFTEHGTAVALVRPDFHVFGTAQSIEDAGKLVSALRSALGTLDSAR